LDVERGKFWNPAVETMAREELRELQLRRLRHQLDYAYHYSSFYRRRFDEAGLKPDDVKSLEDFEKVPMLYKDDLREERSRTGDPFGGILCVPLDERVVSINASTGTTGIPTIFAYTKHDIMMAVEQDLRVKWGRGYRAGTKVYFTGFRWHGYVVLAYTAADIIGFGAYLDCGYPLPYLSAKHMQVLRGYKPEVYGGPILTLYSIIETAKKSGVDPKEIFSNTKIIDTGYGDIVTKAVKKRLEDETGVPSEKIYDFGGVADPLWYWGDCDYHEGVHSCDDLFLTEVRDPETHEKLAEGERGEVTVTNLFAEATPIIKWGTEDIGYITTEKCKCGRTHTRISFLGREAFMANIKGMKIFPADIENVLGDIPGFTEYFTMIKYSTGPMDVLRMKLAVDWDKVDDAEAFKAKLKERLKERLGVESEIEFVKSVSELPFVGHKVVKLLDETKKQAG